MTRRSKKEQKRTPVDTEVKLKESKKRDKFQELARKLKKKSMERENYGDTKWFAWNNLKRLRKGSERLRNQKTRGDHSNYSIAKISQNTEKSWKPEKTSCHSNSSERQLANDDVKNSLEEK